MVDFGITKWDHHKILEFDGMDFFNIKIIVFKLPYF